MAQSQSDQTLQSIQASLLNDCAFLQHLVESALPQILDREFTDLPGAANATVALNEGAWFHLFLRIIVSFLNSLIHRKTLKRVSIFSGPPLPDSGREGPFCPRFSGSYRQESGDSQCRTFFKTGHLPWQESLTVQPADRSPQTNQNGIPRMTDRKRPRIDQWFDTLEHLWEGPRLQSILGMILVVSFLVLLLLIEFQRNHLLPGLFDSFIPNNPFYAINYAFTLLLIFEVLSLVFSLAHSVSIAVGKQFEILSLILLRSSFKEFIYFPQPVHWGHVEKPILHIFSDATGALLIFIILGFFYRLQKHPPICTDEIDQSRFITAKKLVALIILVIFLGLGISATWQELNGLPASDFFSTFYTVLIFSDILIVLISLSFSHHYLSVFRNSAYALSTVFIRLALVAPPYYNAALALIAGLFTLGITIAYNAFHGRSPTTPNRPGPQTVKSETENPG